MILDTAKVYVGIKELKPNKGFVIQSEAQKGFEEGMRNIGWKPSLPWCAFFVKLMVLKALGPTYANVLSGGVHDSWQKITKSPLWKVVDTPVNDCLVYWDSGEGHGHCGIVTQVILPTIVTIEGNTSPAGSRDGDGVYIQKRTTMASKMKWKVLGYAVPILQSNNEDNSTSVQQS